MTTFGLLLILVAAVVWSLEKLFEAIVHSLLGEPENPREAFWTEFLPGLGAFVGALTLFIGSLFWPAVLTLHPVALVILVGGIASIADIALAMATLSPSRSSKPRKRRSWEDRWKQFEWDQVPPWMQEALKGRQIVIDGQPWIVDEKGRLIPAAQAAPDGRHGSSFWGWLHNLLK